MVVVAAGNFNGEDASLRWPCNCPGVICVAATASSGDLANYSSRGGNVSISAPGGDSHAPLVMLGSADANGTTLSVRTWYGTSFATPNVAGLLALHYHSQQQAVAMPLPWDVVGAGAGMLTTVNALVPSAAPPMASVSILPPTCGPGFFRDPTSADCSPCAAGTWQATSATTWAPASFLLDRKSVV